MPLAKISELFDRPEIPAAATVEVSLPGVMTPAVDTTYFFNKDLLQMGLMWLDPNIALGEQNLLLTGPTGAGKSSFVEQLCARLGKEVWRVACHGRLEFQELLGGFRLVSKEGGGTEMVWIDGPLICAARAGGVLLLDEGNFLSPNVVGALNTVLDGGSIIVPETGEVVKPHPGFRVAMTGNAISGGEDAALYRGVQRMNIALLDRFLCVEVDYLSSLEEALILNRELPTLPGDTIQAMVELAGTVRDMHRQGELETTISTRVLLRWGKLYLKAPRAHAASAQPRAKWAIDFAHLRAVKPEERQSIMTQVELKIV